MMLQPDEMTQLAADLAKTSEVDFETALTAIRNAAADDNRKSERAAQLIFEALGAASACWEKLDGAGVFESTRARAIGEQLLLDLGYTVKPGEGELDFPKPSWTIDAADPFIERTMATYWDECVANAFYTTADEISRRLGAIRSWRSAHADLLKPPLKSPRPTATGSTGLLRFDPASPDPTSPIGFIVDREVRQRTPDPDPLSWDPREAYGRLGARPAAGIELRGDFPSEPLQQDIKIRDTVTDPISTVQQSDRKPMPPDGYGNAID